MRRYYNNTPKLICKLLPYYQPTRRHQATEFTFRTKHTNPRTKNSPETRENKIVSRLKGMSFSKALDITTETNGNCYHCFPKEHFLIQSLLSYQTAFTEYIKVATPRGNSGVCKQKGDPFQLKCSCLQVFLFHQNFYLGSELVLLRCYVYT